MKIWLILNVGIMVLIVAGCVGSPLIPQSTRELSSITAVDKQNDSPKPLSALSCSAEQRIVIAASHVESPDVAGIANRSWLYFLPSIPMAIPTDPHIYNLAWITSPKSSPKDLTTEFKKAIGEVLSSVDLQRLLLAQAEQVIKPRSPCKTTFVPTTLEKSTAYNSADRIVVIGFYFMFKGNLASSPSLWACLTTTVMTRENAAELAKHTHEREKIMSEMKKLETYVRVTDKRPDIVKLEQYAALGKKLENSWKPYIDGTGTVTCESPSHSTDEWLANEGAVVKHEIASVMDRLIGNVAGILFK